MRKLKIIAWLSAALLAGCGGGNTLTGSTTTGGGTGTSTVATVGVTSSAASIAADGSDSATITAVAKDSNNNFVSGATVTFSSAAGGLAVTQATTDASGRATATLSAGGAASGTAITVTASAGTASGTTTVNVVNTQQTLTLTTDSPQVPSNNSKSANITAFVRGSNNQFLEGVTVSFQATSGGLTVTQAVTDASGAAKATLNAAGDPTNRTVTVTATAGSATGSIPVAVAGTKLSVSGPQNVVLGGQPATYTFALVDSANIGISNTQITVTSSLGNAIATSPASTDSTGTATVQYTATTAGNDTITASALGISATQTVAVSNQSFALTAPATNAKINLGAVQPVTVVWTSAGVPQANKQITFTATRGTLSVGSATTDGTGTATVTISSTTAGPAIISASSTGVSTQVPVSFIATTPASIDLQASPATIPTQGQSTLTAIVRDAQNNLVEGKTVSFSLTDVTGGVLSVASAITDSQGKAQTVYTASSTPSATNGVSISATISPVAPATTTLTVGGQTVFLTLGTGNKISDLNLTQYGLPFVVQASDAAGNGVANVNVTLTVASLEYLKGRLVNDPSQSTTNWVVGPTAPPCGTEDINFNAILDSGEDLNNNGKLDPGGVALADPGTVISAAAGAKDSTGNPIPIGSAFFQVVYPKDHANWVKVRLTATTRVAGTETNVSSDFYLVAADADMKLQVAPPGPTSPYGVATSCGNPN